MVLFSKKHRYVDCNGSLLFDILDDNLNDGLCTDILFLYKDEKHRFGAYGYNGNTRKNVVFYLDDLEVKSREAIEEKGFIGETRLKDISEVRVVECDGCYPESTPRLKALMEP